MFPILLALIPSFAAAPQNCDAAVFDLLAGQTIMAGDVTVTNSGDTLRIDVELHPHGTMHLNALIWAVHIYAGFGPPPTNGGGNVSPGSFPYKTDYPLGVTHHTELIPLSDLGAVCGDTVQVAVHAEVSCSTHGNETAWANGQNPFTGSQWGWWLDYDICCGSNVNAGMDLDVGPLVIGGATAFSAVGAQPGELVTFYRSGKPILMGSGFTKPAFGATVLDIQGPIRKVGTAVADGLGIAAFSKVVPANVPVGLVLAFQAVVLRNPDALASNAVYGVTQ